MKADPNGLPRRQTYGRGLDGLVAGKTDISRIDGKKGELWIRGYSIGDLCRQATFEEAAYLVIHGELPNCDALQAWQEELCGWRDVPPAALRALERLPRDAHPLMKYRTMLAVAACLMPEGENSRLDAQWRRPARILAWTAGLAASAVRHMAGKPPVPPERGLSFAENFLLQALGELPDTDYVRGFEVSLIAQVEHGIHAAALAAWVVASTGADLGSAVLAGMGALSGARHGGANQLAFEMFRSLPNAESARRWTQKRLDESYRFPGFGHRVYKAPDPRVGELAPWAERLLARKGEERLWEVFCTVRSEVESALGPRGIFANVDAVTGLIYHPLGLQAEAMPIPFALAIQTGWMAHCLEYIPLGKMIEPGAMFTDGVIHTPH